MKALVQRVSQAKVTVDGEIVGAIDAGLLVLLGIHVDDKEGDIPWLVNKVANLRIFRDENDKMNLSLKDIGGGCLIVSQFTLYGTCTAGRRPEFTQAMAGTHAQDLYNQFVTQMQSEIDQVETGRFGAYMQVDLTNDGPVTLMVEKSA